MTYEEMCVMLLKCENFSMARYGDGEFACLLGDSGKNCDGAEYFTDLAEALRTVLRSKPTYYLGMQPLAQNRMGGRINKWLSDEGIDVDWFNADIIHDASIAGKLGELIQALHDRKVICVMPQHLKPFADRLKAPHIVVPDHIAWKFYRTSYTDLIEQIAYTGKDTVVLYCAGLATEVMIHHVWNDYGDTVTQIDLGSVLEPYVTGLPTRRYHKQIIDRIREQA